MRKTTQVSSPIDPAIMEKGRACNESFDRERKLRSQENGRRSSLNFIRRGFASIGFLVWIFICMGPLELVFNQWGFGFTLSAVTRVILCFALPVAFWLTALWVSEITGLHYMIEDWIESWDTWNATNIQKYKQFPRRKRRALVRDLKKELDVVRNQISRLTEESYEEEYGDRDLSGSLDIFRQIIHGLVDEAECFSHSLISRPEGASWKDFCRNLEGTFKELQEILIGEADYDEFDERVQPLVKQAFQIVNRFRTILEQATANNG
jgi:hypothetical protein